jgi:type I restriction enzyme, S subunit
MEVRPGYTQTEVGIIPVDWDVEVVGDAFEIRNQLRLPISQSVRERMPGPYPYYGPTSVQGWINEYRVEGEHALIGEDGDHFLKWREQAMTLLVSGKFNVNNHAHIVRGTKNLTAWFYWFFANRDIADYLTRQGAGRYKLTKAALLELRCAVPPILEQRAITTALSDVDALLGGLDRLIAKKRDLKQAAMQQLLTGQTRLPGFHGGWSAAKISELCEYESGVPTAGGEQGYVEIGDIDVEFKSYDVGGKNKPAVRGAVKVPGGTLLISTVRPTRGAIAITREEIYVSSAFCRLRPSNGFLFHLVCQAGFLAYLGENSFGGTYPTCRDETILSYECPLPSDSEEQRAIATVLSDMDAEIVALEKRRDKTRDLKQAMMQELLTGKTRLVPAGGAHA